MIETVLFVILFIIGIYFGSFFTLATYRLPKKENIVYKHSYCPNCEHKLGLFDLVPLFSFIILKGKCRYCNHKIGIRYFLYELFSGITFVLLGISLQIFEVPMQLSNLFLLGILILYFASLFIIAGIDKTAHTIQKSVLFFGIFVSILYMIYSYTLGILNVYEYVIYLFMMAFLILFDTILLKKKLKYNYTIQILILSLYMLMVSGVYHTIYAWIFVILVIGFKNLFVLAKTKKSRKVVTKKDNRPVGFYLCIGNMIMILGTNFLLNYVMKL